MQMGLNFEGVKGLRSCMRCLEVKEYTPLPWLRAWVEGNEELQQLLDRVEALRSSAAGRWGDSLLPHEECAGRARAALLRGRGKLFNACYRRYVKVGEYEWHPDLNHYFFWDSVLGPGWTGGDLLPEGEARQEYEQLSAIAFAFCAAPSGSVGGRGEMPEIAAALRVADASALRLWAGRGSETALAALDLLAGRWRQAQQRFGKSFGRAAENRYALEAQHAMPVLVYALLTGIMAGGKVSFLRAWFCYLREMVQVAFPPSMYAEQEELMRFLDHLEMVDGIVNRHFSLLPQPSLGGALSCLPFAMAYSALPQYLRYALAPDTLAAAVHSLAQDGLRLLAVYGAAGLLHAGVALSSVWKKRMDAILAAAEGIALPPVRTSAAGRAMEALRVLVEERRKEGSLLWKGEATPVLTVSRTEMGAVLNLNGTGTDGAGGVWEALRQESQDGLLLLDGADAAELTQLCVDLQGVAEVQGSLVPPGDEVQESSPQWVLVCNRAEGGRYAAALRLRLLPGALPLVIPGKGFHELVVEQGDRAIALRRDLRAEQRLHAPQLPTLSGTDGACPLSCECQGVEQLALLLDWCRREGIDACWEKGKPLRLHRPPGGLRLLPGEGSGNWLELGAELPVDEGRVLELATLLEAAAQREGNWLCVGGSEYVQLNECLLRQLALLELAGQERRGKRGISAAALPLLEALGEEALPPAAARAPVPLPEGLQVSLRRYQQEGYAWLAERADKGLGAILADDMGLGKTVQTLALLLREAGQGAMLVVAPVSLLGNWAAEAARFAPTLRVLPYDSRSPESLAEAGAGTLVLVSYGQLVSRLKDFRAHSWNAVVLDEAQAVKNPDSQRARAVCELRARLRFCLTGTPIENNLLDVWSQMRFLNPGLLGSRAAFIRRFGKAGEDARALLRRTLSPLVLRRRKQDVLRQLPPRTEMVEWVEFSGEERALYESLRRAAVDKLGTGEGSSGVGILAELTRLRRACCHGKLALAGFAGASAKLAALAGMVDELRDSGHRALVFSQFTDVLDLAQDLLQGQGIRCLRLDGSTPAAQRTARVREFQQGEADTFLISLKAGGTGLNLTAADYVILLDPWWNPAVEAQAAGRSHRMGQAYPVTLCRLIVRDTVEERILALHCDKQELAESILAGSGESLSLDTLRSLLER